MEPIYRKNRIMRELLLQYYQRKREPPLLSPLNLEKLGNNADGVKEGRPFTYKYGLGRSIFDFFG